MNASYNTLVECSCRSCKTYALAKGLSFPMQAMAQEGAARVVKASALVHSAYDSVLKGATNRPSIAL
jgi:hypothetical protein